MKQNLPSGSEGLSVSSLEQKEKLPYPGSLFLLNSLLRQIGFYFKLHQQPPKGAAADRQVLASLTLQRRGISHLPPELYNLCCGRNTTIICCLYPCFQAPLPAVSAGDTMTSFRSARKIWGSVLTQVWLWDFWDLYHLFPLSCMDLVPLEWVPASSWQLVYTNERTF